MQNKLYTQTPTHSAIINKVSDEMVIVFKEHNGDIYSIKDKYDKSPFDYAKELKDEEYINLLIKIFGENKDVSDKKRKTFDTNKIPENIVKQTDKNFNLNIKNNFHNSDYNILPEKLSNIFSGEDLKKEEFKLENYEEIIKSKKMGVLTSGDNLYSDRRISNKEESNKSKTGNINNNINIENNNNNQKNLVNFKLKLKLITILMVMMIK